MEKFGSFFRETRLASFVITENRFFIGPAVITGKNSVL